MSRESERNHWEGHTDATLEGIAKTLDEVHVDIKEMRQRPCRQHGTSLRILWSIVLIMLAAIVAMVYPGGTNK